MRIGTRGSDLALWQARYVRALLQKEAGIEAELVIIKTAGDLDQASSLSAMADKGFFTKEIEDALLAGQIDVAVHSLKDMQTMLPSGLKLCAMPQRADRRDVLLMHPEAVDPARTLRLKAGARIGTSANRRIAQLRFLRPDCDVQDLRGNVPTRVRRLREGKYDAIVAAAAGLDRLALDLTGLVAYRLPEMLFVPAPGQGTLGLQIRADDEPTRRVIGALDRNSVRRTVNLEREILRRLEGGCQLALGTAADEVEHGLRLSAFLGTGDPAAPRRIIAAGSDGEAVLVAVESYLRGEAQHDVCGRRARIWITREPGRAEAFRAACDEELLDVSAVPTFYAIEAGSKDAHAAAANDLDSYDWLFLTSQIAVQCFADILQKHSASLGERPRVAAIGHKTAAAIKRLGWRVDFVSDVADAHALAESFAAVAGDHVGRVLFPCAQVASDTLQTEMAAECDGFERLVCYDTREHPQLAATIAALPDPDAIVFTSPQAARFLIGRRPVDHDVTAVAIGPATTEALLAAGFTLIYEAPERSMEGTAEVINGLFTAPATPPLTPYAAHT